MVIIRNGTQQQRRPRINSNETTGVQKTAKKLAEMPGDDDLQKLGAGDNHQPALRLPKENEIPDITKLP